MKRRIRYIAVILAALVLSVTVYGAVGMLLPVGDHVAMVQHDGADCVSNCISRVQNDYVIPFIQESAQRPMTIGSEIESLVISTFFVLIFTLYAAKPRPAPNLIALNLNYLE